MEAGIRRPDWSSRPSAGPQGRAASAWIPGALRQQALCWWRYGPISSSATASEDGGRICIDITDRNCRKRFGHGRGLADRVCGEPRGAHRAGTRGSTDFCYNPRIVGTDRDAVPERYRAQLAAAGGFQSARLRPPMGAGATCSRYARTDGISGGDRAGPHRHRGRPVSCHRGDITARMQAERAPATLEAERRPQRGRTRTTAQGLFLATVSHELRTPLNTILGWSSC